MEIGGQRKGPYSVAQIYSLLKEGAIFPATRVLCADPDTKSTTVQDLIRVHKESLAGLPPTHAPLSSMPPQGPATAYEDYGAEDDDPVNSLFTTLQVAKDRQTKITQKTPRRIVYEDPAVAFTPSAVFRWRWLTFVFAGSLITGYGALRLLQNKAEAPQTVAHEAASAPQRSTASTPDDHADTARPVSRTLPSIGSSKIGGGQSNLSKVKIVEGGNNAQRAPSKTHQRLVNGSYPGISPLKAPPTGDDRDNRDADQDRDREGRDRSRDPDRDSDRGRDSRPDNGDPRDENRGENRGENKDENSQDSRSDTRNPASNGQDSENPESKGKEGSQINPFEGNPQTGGVLQQ